MLILLQYSFISSLVLYVFYPLVNSIVTEPQQADAAENNKNSVNISGNNENISNGKKKLTKIIRLSFIICIVIGIFKI